MQNYIYLDYNSCSIVLPKVRETINGLMIHPLNPSSIHYLGQKGYGYLEETSDYLKEYLNCSNKYKILFTSSGSESNNFAINNLKFNPNESFDIWCCSAGEHKSVLYPMQNHPNHFIIPITPDVIVDESALYYFLEESRSKKIFLSLIYANNESGSINDLKKIVRNARNIHNNLIIHSDFGQALGKLPLSSEITLDLQSLDLDLVTIISYKFGGLIGTSALIYKKDLILIPSILGGSQGENLRAGTENILAIYSMKIALENQPSKNAIENLRDYFELKLKKIICPSKLTIFSSDVPRVGNTSYFAIEGLTSKSQLIYYNQFKMYVGSGSACSVGIDEDSHVLKAAGYSSNVRKNAVRVSLGYTNTKEDVDLLLEKVENLCARYHL